MTSTDFIPFALPDIGDAEIHAATDAMRSGWLTTGPNAAAFEREFVEFLGGGCEAIAVNSATAGLHLALEALGIGPGDEVLVPDWTFTATAEVVRYLGAQPVLVDVLPDTLNIDLEAARHKVTDRTKAVMPVHFAGLPVDRAGIRALADECHLMVVEDAAHAFPVHSAGELVGLGDSEAVVFSFYATKTITTGEGGMVVVRDEEVARRVRTMRLHGISRDVFDRYRSTKPSWHYEVVAPGFKYNLPDPAAAMGRVQLGRAFSMRDARRAIAERYLDELADTPLAMPPSTADPEGHAWHLFVVRAPEGHRDDFIQRMADAGVGCSVHFIPLHRHPYWAEQCHAAPDDLPVAERAINNVVSLPIFSSMTDAQVDRVVSAARSAL